MGYVRENRLGFPGFDVRVTDETPAESQLGRALRDRDLASIRAADPEAAYDGLIGARKSDRRTIAKLRAALKSIATDPAAPPAIQSRATRALAEVAA